MNQKRTKAVMQLGIVPGTAVNELNRWGANIPLDVQPLADPQEALENIQEALESPETVAMRTTELDALQYYKQHEQEGRLYYASTEGTTFIKIHYAKNQFGQYLIPWRDEEVYDLMLSEKTYLKPENEPRVYFADVHELHYGEEKAFMVCVPETPNFQRHHTVDKSEVEGYLP